MRANGIAPNKRYPVARMATSYSRTKLSNAATLATMVSNTR